MRLIIPLLIVLLPFSVAAESYLFQWDDDTAGTSWTGWTRYEDENEVITSGHPGWIIKPSGEGGPHDGLKAYGAWGSRPGSYEHRCTDGRIITSDRAPSTSTGGAIEYFWTAAQTTGGSGADCYTTYGNRPSWWVWHDGEQIRQKTTMDITSSTDRMSMYVKTSGHPQVSRANGTGLEEYTHHVGTYLCWDTGITGTSCPYESPGQHYYHYVVADPEVWVHLLLDQHPQHKRDDFVPGDNPSQIEYGYDYFYNFYQFYYLVANASDETAGYIRLDEIKFMTASETGESNQNDESITSVAVWYNTSTDKWGISWHDMSYETGTGTGLNDNTMSTFQVKYSTSPITNTNWSSATDIAGDYYTGTTHTGATDLSIVRKSGPYNTQCFTEFKIPDEVEAANDTIYFAIKDVSSAGNNGGSNYPFNRVDDRDPVSSNVHTTWYSHAALDKDSPIVTDGSISISGATGTGGAFRVGDTITATWDNTAGGDNNDDISSVTVDFSQFGGGSTVVATNSSETWTATYTITSGGIDGTNLNVSVSATDNVGNLTTTIDTSNAVLDNISPTVTDANISISGATGTGGAFRVGDTITATWDNTAGGDNNDDISSVTVDFSQFGGGSTVVATNSSETWTATYAIPEGAGGGIEAVNRNISVNAVDNRGNSSVGIDGANATVDTGSPAAPNTPDLSAASDTGTSDTDNITSDTTPTFAGISEGNTTVEVSSSVDGLLGATTADGGGNWRYTASTNLTASVHFITAVALDAAGNISPASGGLAVTIDGIIPTVPSVPDLAAITDNGVSTTDDKTSDTTPIFTGIAESNTTVSLISSVDGQIGSVSTSSGNWSITTDVLSYGSHSIMARATDKAGNVSTPSAGLSILINHDPVFTGTPVIAGKGEVNEILSVEDTTTTDADGESVILSYQWLRDGVAVPGATKSTYQLQSNDLSSTISCEIRALDVSGGMASFVTSERIFNGGLPWEVLLPAIVAPKDK